MEKNEFQYRFTVKKKFFTLLGKEFSIIASEGNLVAYARQKAFKLREEITFYTDKTMKTPLVRIKARNILDFGATFDVIDTTTEEQLGSWRRMGIRSLFRDEWRAMTPSGQEYAILQEDSMIAALFRRFFIPLVPQTFHLKSEEKEIGAFIQKFDIFRYILSVDVDTTEISEKMAWAGAILLATIDGRQE